MSHRIKYIIVVLIAFSGGALFAQNALTLEDCRTKAVEYNKELKKANLKQKEAEETQKATRTTYLPTISGDANAMHINGLDDIEMPGGFLPTAASAEQAQSGVFTGVSDVWSPGISIELGNKNIFYGGLSLTQPLYVGGKIVTANRMADLGVDVANLSFNLKYSEIIQLTDQAFWNVAMVESNIALAKKYIEMLVDTEELMTAMYDVGLQPASEKLKVSVQKNEAELQLMRARNGLRIAKMNLNQILGNSLESEIEIVYDSIENLKLINMINGNKMADANRDELKLLEKQVEMSTLDKKMVMSDYLPQLGVSVQYQTNYVDEYAEDFDFTPIVAAQLTIPIFNWGQKYKKKRAAQYIIKQNEMELSHNTDLVHLQVQSTKVLVEEAYESIIIAEKNIIEAEESLDETKSSFEVGINSTTDLLIAQTNWLTARAQRIEAVANYRVLETKWQKVTGQLQPMQ